MKRGLSSCQAGVWYNRARWARIETRYFGERDKAVWLWIGLGKSGTTSWWRGRGMRRCARRRRRRMRGRRWWFWSGRRSICAGGNSFFTGGLFRFAYDGIDDIVGIIPEIGEQERQEIDVGSYPQAKFYDDLMRVTEGLSDPELAQVLVSQSYPTMKWLQEQGVRWILAYGRQAFRHERRLRFWGGLIVEGGWRGQGAD